MANQMRGHYRPHKRVQYTGELVHPHTGQITKPPSRTKQEFRKECDINNIIKAYQKTGIVQHINAQAAQGAYRDLPDHIDFQESLHLVEAARASFMSLPSKIRDRFGQDPVRFLEFCADPANLEEMQALGIAERPANPPPPPPEKDKADAAPPGPQNAP